MLEPRRFEVTIPATGTLLPAESVELVSELSRRLVKIGAKEGQKVKKGDLLFQLDASDLKAELSRLTIQEAQAKTVAERSAKLVAEQVGTQAESDAATAQLEEIKAARRILAVTLERTQIRAPFDGTLGLRRVSEGAWLTPATVLSTIEDTSALKLDFKIPERYAAAAITGTPFQVVLEGIPERLQGTITAVESSVDIGSRSLTVRGVIQDALEFRPGIFAKVELPVVVEDALLIPSLLLVSRADGRHVFVEKDGVAHSVPVQLGARDPEFVHVLGGLAPGDRVITTNLLRLRDGIPVQVKDKQ